MSTTVEKIKCLIIGSGPAGYTAAIYAARASMNPVLYQGMQPGGQLTTTTEIENFPGWPEGIMGGELMERTQKQAEKFGAKVEFAVVNEIEVLENAEHKFKVSNQEFDAVIIASGASAKYLGIPNEESWIGKGYHSCATCDGFFYKNKVIAVAGGGDSAMEEANFLTKFASKVYIIHRNDTFKASEIMLKRAQNNEKIEFLTNKVITAFEGKDHVEKIMLIDNKTNETSELEISGVFVAIGHKPNTDFVKQMLPVDNLGYLSKTEGTMTSISGIFAAGDVADKHYRQAITAAGDGCKAAIDCMHWLEKEEK